MADRYWVGGTDTWNGTAGSKWATTSGGGGGAAVPTAADDVFFDANSGSAVVSLTGAFIADCKAFNCTGFTGEIAGAGGLLRANGAFTLVPGMVWSASLNIRFEATSGPVALTFAGKDMLSNIVFGLASVGGTWELQDALSIPNHALQLRGGTLDTNDQDVTCASFESADISKTRVLTLGASVVEVTMAGTAWNVANSNLTIDAGTSHIIVSGESVGEQNFLGDGFTYYNVTFRDSGGFRQIRGSTNRFNDLTIESPNDIRFDSGFTQTLLGNFVVAEGVLIGSVSTGVHTLSKSSGTVTVNGGTIQKSNAIGGATWNAVGSADLGGNTGWNFLGANARGMFQFFASS